MTAIPTITRRFFLRAAVAGFFLLHLPGRVYASIVKRFPTRTVDNLGFDFDPVSGELRHHDGRAEPFVLELDGLVAQPKRFTYQELRALPGVAQTSDFHCVEGWSLLDVNWGGLLFGELFRHVEIQPEAKYAVFHALGSTPGGPGGLDHYVESFALDDLLDPSREFLLAMDLEGEPLPKDRGAPLRLVCPQDLAYKSIKFVHRIEFTTKRADGWWTRANPIYPWEAPVPKHRLRS